MKQYRNISNQRLQFVTAKLEIAPGQVVELTDSVVKNDPGFESCLDRGLIEDLAVSRRSKTGPKVTDKTLTASGQKGKSKVDLFEAKDGGQPEPPPSDDKKDE